MQFLIVFACAVAAASAGWAGAPLVHAVQAQHLPVIGPNGVPIDTPAVQHATAAHLAHKVEAHARNGDWALGHAPIIAHGAAPIAYAGHHHGIAAPVAAYPIHHGIAVGGPAAYPTTAVHPTSVNGVPLETPEVVAAKSSHFAAHAEALARTGHGWAHGAVAPHHLYKRGIIAASPLAYSSWGGHAYGAYGAYPYAATAGYASPYYF